MKQNHINKVTDEEIIAAYNDLKTLSKIAAKFDLPDVTIWRRAKKLGLEFKSGGYDKIDLKEILNGLHPHYQTFKLKNRLLKEKVFQNKCSCCGIEEWNGNPINMQLDHIDGNSKNHKLDNLRMICPNCHSQTETYCGKNKQGVAPYGGL